MTLDGAAPSVRSVEAAIYSWVTSYQLRPVSYMAVRQFDQPDAMLLITVACFTLLILAWYQLFVSAICYYQLFLCGVCRIVSSAAQQHWMSLNCALVVERTLSFLLFHMLCHRQMA
jgi:hypothetical protein